MTGRGSWDSYWAHGCPTSCADAYSGNYEGPIRTLWDRRFAALPDGSHILDIGTGNGAIALIAAAAAQLHDREFEIHGLDLADINPQRDLANESRALLRQIKFHPRTDAARTGFANDSFDLVTGQFALEYTALPAAVRELARVTAADGENMFVIHHQSSIIVATAAEELRHIDLLLHETGLLDRALELVDKIEPAPAKHKTTGPTVERCRQAFNNAAASVSAAVAAATHPEILRMTLGRIRAAWRLSQAGDPTAAMECLHRTKTEIAANADRLAGLSRAALSARDIDRLAGLYTAHGFADVCVETLSEHPARLIAWLLRARFL